MKLKHSSIRGPEKEILCVVSINFAKYDIIQCELVLLIFTLYICIKQLSLCLVVPCHMGKTTLNCLNACTRLDYQPLFGKMNPRSLLGEERRPDSREQWKLSLCMHKMANFIVFDNCNYMIFLLQEMTRLSR